jgi:hypothetical protein
MLGNNKDVSKKSNNVSENWKNSNYWLIKWKFHRKPKWLNRNFGNYEDITANWLTKETLLS